MSRQAPPFSSTSVTFKHSASRILPLETSKKEHSHPQHCATEKSKPFQQSRSSNRESCELSHHTGRGQKGFQDTPPEWRRNVWNFVVRWLKRLWIFMKITLCVKNGCGLQKSCCATYFCFLFLLSSALNLQSRCASDHRDPLQRLPHAKIHGGRELLFVFFHPLQNIFISEVMIKLIIIIF